jgi:hypothetical protein
VQASKLWLMFGDRHRAPAILLDEAPESFIYIANKLE